MRAGVNKNIVILISGSGSNMAAIVDASRRCHWRQRHGAQVVAVFSNKTEAPGLSLARELGLQTGVIDHTAYPTREGFDAALIAQIDQHQPALVVLAGFMRILTPLFVSHYADRLINIHPSLLPAFTGLKTHQRAIDAGCHVAGCTVHRVTGELDYGEILEQAVVPVLPSDTAESLAARVLTQEHLIYPRVVERLITLP